MPASKDKRVQRLNCEVRRVTGTKQRTRPSCERDSIHLCYIHARTVQCSSDCARLDIMYMSSPFTARERAYHILMMRANGGGWIYPAIMQKSAQSKHERVIPAQEQGSSLHLL